MTVRRYEGVWWLPEAPDTRIAGTLVSSRDTLMLELIGSFLDPGEGLEALLRAGEMEIYPLVLGRDKSGVRIALQDATSVGVSRGAGVLTQRIVSPMGFVGAEVESLEELRWRVAHVQFRHLREWFERTPGMDVDFELGPGGALETYRMGYSRPDPLVAEVADARVELTPNVHFTHAPFRGHTLEPTAHWRVVTAEPQTVSELWRQFVVPLQDLLTLGTAAPCTVTDFRVSSDDQVPLPPTVEVLGPTTRHGTESERARRRGEMLFTAAAIEEDFTGALNRWLSGTEELRAPRSLVFSAQYLPEPSLLESRFLSLAQAAESYHRVRFPSEELPEDQHAARVASILEVAPAEHQTWLVEKLQHTNDVSFRSRLRDLYDSVEAVIQPLQPRRNDFVQVVVSARNDFVHLGHIDLDAIGIEQFFYAVESLEFMMFACFMRELGIGGESIAALLRENTRYKVSSGRTIS